MDGVWASVAVSGTHGVRAFVAQHPSSVPGVLDDGESLLGLVPVTVLLEETVSRAKGACVVVLVGIVENGDLAALFDGEKVSVGDLRETVALAMTQAVSAPVAPTCVTMRPRGGKRAVPKTSDAAVVVFGRGDAAAPTDTVVRLGVEASYRAMEAQRNMPGQVLLLHDDGKELRDIIERNRKEADARFEEYERRREESDARIEKITMELGKTTATVKKHEESISALREDVRVIMEALWGVLTLVSTRHVIEYLHVAAYAIHFNRTSGGSRAFSVSWKGGWNGFVATNVVGKWGCTDQEVEDGLVDVLGLPRSVAAILADSALYQGVSKTLHNVKHATAFDVARRASSSIPPGVSEALGADTPAMSMMADAYATLRRYRDSYPAAERSRVDDGCRVSRRPETFEDAIRWFTESEPSGALSVRVSGEKLPIGPDEIKRRFKM